MATPSAPRSGYSSPANASASTRPDASGLLPPPSRWKKNAIPPVETTLHVTKKTSRVRPVISWATGSTSSRTASTANRPASTVISGRFGSSHVER